jgi:hypothetical protein
VALSPHGNFGAFDGAFDASFDAVSRAPAAEERLSGTAAGRADFFVEDRVSTMMLFRSKQNKQTKNTRKFFHTVLYTVY